jgi:hypothetical protein
VAISSNPSPAPICALTTYRQRALAVLVALLLGVATAGIRFRYRHAARPDEHNTNLHETQDHPDVATTPADRQHAPNDAFNYNANGKGSE